MTPSREVDLLIDFFFFQIFLAPFHLTLKPVFEKKKKNESEWGRFYFILFFFF